MTKKAKKTLSPNTHDGTRLKPNSLSKTGHLERSRGERPVGFTLFVSETDRSFATSEVEMTRLFGQQPFSFERIPTGRLVFFRPVCTVRKAENEARTV
ncbi:hypothetical protein L596_021319 [Steinernema carpocapsae]|nr:hypothetical protein L596_021319 [Steinernema carpocapsae]